METTAAILVRMTRLTDTSLIVHWFTEDFGLMKTVAKGALRPKSPFAGKLDLFFSGEISVARSRRGDLHILRELVVTDWRQGLRRSYDTTLMAGYFCSLLEMCVEVEQPDAGLHDLLRRALDYLAREEPDLRALRYFEKCLAESLGIFEGNGKGRIVEIFRENVGNLPLARKEIFERFGEVG